LAPELPLRLNKPPPPLPPAREPDEERVLRHAQSRRGHQVVVELRQGAGGENKNIACGNGGMGEVGGEFAPDSERRSGSTLRGNQGRSLDKPIGLDRITGEVFAGFDIDDCRTCLRDIQIVPAQDNRAHACHAAHFARHLAICLKDVRIGGAQGFGQGFACPTMA